MKAEPVHSSLSDPSGPNLFPWGWQRSTAPCVRRWEQANNCNHSCLEKYMQEHLILSQEIICSFGIFQKLLSLILNMKWYLKFVLINYLHSKCNIQCGAVLLCPGPVLVLDVNLAVWSLWSLVPALEHLPKHGLSHLHTSNSQHVLSIPYDLVREAQEGLQVVIPRICEYAALYGKGRLRLQIE